MAPAPGALFVLALLLKVVSHLVHQGVEVPQRQAAYVRQGEPPEVAQ